MLLRRYFSIKWICSSLFLSFLQYAAACTGIVHKDNSGNVIYARTMEFGVDILNFNLIFVPRGIAYSSQIAKNKNGATWKTKYAHIGFNPANNPILIDGVNEKGLACGGFYFPGWTQYETVAADQLASAVANTDFISWVLGNFSSVREVKEALQETKVIGALFPEWGLVPPLHYIVVDELGDKIVIEYVGGKQNIHDAWIGTITNAPTYDWHLTNARNYIGLTELNRPAIKIEGHDLAQFGQGSGALGLPGDFTPPSRFIRASFLNQVVLTGNTAQEQIQRAFKILNQFDIPKGSVKSVEGGKVHYEETQWTSASDLKNRRYFFHTSKNRTIKFVDLNQMNLTSNTIQTIQIDIEEPFIDISKLF